MSKIDEITDEMLEISEKLTNLVAEYNDCIPSVTEDRLYEMLHSMPVESLRDSLDIEYNKKTERFSLYEMNKISALRKEKDRLIRSYNSKQIELNIAKIESVMGNIDEV
jgi:hypothetical protein